jgi:hypothetical protein
MNIESAEVTSTGFNSLGNMGHGSQSQGGSSLTNFAYNLDEQ